MSPGLCRFAIAAMVVLLAAGGRTASAQDRPGDATPPCRPCSFLILDADDTNRPAFQALLAGLREVAARPTGTRDNVYIENLDFARFPGEAHAEGVSAWLARKYAGQQVDAIVTVTSRPLGVATALRSRLWPSAVLLTLDFAEDARHAGHGLVITDIDVAGTVRAAMALFPGTRRIELIGGPGYGDVVGQAILEEASTVTPLDIRFAPVLSVQELRAYVQAASPDTVFLFSSVYRDRTGAVTVPREVLDSVAAASSRPIFGFSTTYLGHGIVGGHLLDFEQIGRRLGEAVARTVAFGVNAPGPLVRVPAQLMLDQRQLRRWKVRDHLVPQQALVLYRQPSAFEQYRDAITATIATLLLQTTWIAWLLVERRHRRRAERQLHDLSGRVIETQEQERARIARDLHDDVNQRVALAAVELDGIAAAGMGEVPSAARVRAVADELRVLGLDVHAIAHQLRPAELEALGLTAALRSLAETVTDRAGIRVGVVEDGDIPPLPETVSIVLYRVAQEALQNVRKHSGAQHCDITVAPSPAGILLRIADDGAGFVASARASDRHLGVIGMHERLRLVGGTLTVRSAPGSGTTLEAVVPLPISLDGEGNAERVEA